MNERFERSSITRFWLAPIGAEVTSLCIRGVALAVLLFGLKTYTTAPTAHLTAPGAWAFHFWVLSGLVTFGVGARRALLVPMGLLALRCTWSNHRPDELLLWFPAAEWPVFIAVPLALALMTTDRAASLVLRWSGASSLFFAGLHKMNTDFFEPTVTCNRLSERLTEWWSLPPATYGWVTPAVVVCLEMGTPLLLVLAPRFGVLLALGVLVQFVSIGATALSTLLMVCLLAFLPRDDLIWMRERATWLPLAMLPGVIASWLLYQGPWSWPQYGFCHGLFGAGLMAVGTRLFAARSVTGLQRTLPTETGVLAVFVLLLSANGLAPYTGLKFQYSFAMLSNLRVDDERQNSLWAPEQVRWFDDPFVHVHEVTYLDSRGLRLSGGDLVPDLWNPTELKRVKDRVEAVNERLLLRGTYQGRPVTETDIDALPDAPWFQTRVTRPKQQCLH